MAGLMSSLSISPFLPVVTPMSPSCLMGQESPSVLDCRATASSLVSGAGPLLSLLGEALPGELCQDRQGGTDWSQRPQWPLVLRAVSPLSPQLHGYVKVGWGVACLVCLSSPCCVWGLPVCSPASGKKNL